MPLSLSPPPLSVEGLTALSLSPLPLSVEGLTALSLSLSLPLSVEEMTALSLSLSLPLGCRRMSPLLLLSLEGQFELGKTRCPVGVFRMTGPGPAYLIYLYQYIIKLYRGIVISAVGWWEARQHGIGE